jgi:methylase of polypeptide subunit release factors
VVDYRDLSANDIWLDVSNRSETLNKALRELDRTITPDSIFSKLLDSSLDSVFHKNKDIFLPYTNLNEWIIGFDSHSNKVVKHLHLFIDAPNRMKFLDFIEQLRSRVIDHIQNLINEAILVGRMPNKGIVLYFSQNVDNRFLITYDARSGRPRISFVDRMDGVRSIFDLEEIGKLKSQRAKNIAKAFLQSGHKAVMQYGVLTHVDRRRHFEVFGPSIDTLHMSHIMLSDDSFHKIDKILEIGIGSGHIICSAINNKTNLDYVDGIDVNPFAILCSNENLQKVVNVSNPNHSPKDISLMIGMFHKDKFQRGYDLVICNPPYVTANPADAGELESDYALATVGTALIKEILSALPHLLRPGGRCLMMVSSVTIGFEDDVPAGLVVRPAQGDRTIRVPFDVEAVNNSQSFLEYLFAQKAVERDHPGGHYTHILKPYWIEVAS